MTAVEIGLAAKGAAFALLLSAVPAGAQNARPAKLIVMNGTGIAVTDYPSMDRCEAARTYIANMIERSNAARQTQHLPGGGVIMELPLSLRTFCVPG